jgi:hypothetical protein
LPLLLLRFRFRFRFRLQLADTRQDRHSYAHADVLSGAARAPDDDHERRTRLPAKELYTVTTACEPKAGVTKVHEKRMCRAWTHAQQDAREASSRRC